MKTTKGFFVHDRDATFQERLDGMHIVSTAPLDPIRQDKTFDIQNCTFSPNLNRTEEEMFSLVELDDGSGWWVRMKGVTVIPTSEITHLRAELAEARKDAERYRWLRSGKTGKEINCTIGGAWSAWINGPELDAAIDADIQKAKP